MRLILIVAISLLCRSVLSQGIEVLPCQTAQQIQTKATESQQESLPLPTTDEFRFGGDNLLQHLANDHQAMPELVRLHEALHQAIERLRPDGVASFIVFEGSESDYLAWADRADLERAGWKIVRRPLRGKVAAIVAIGKTHFSHVGYLTKAKLQSFIDQARPRKTVPKQGKQQITKIVMGTREGCDWCDLWKSVDMPKAIADGVQIEFQVDATGKVPWFEICSGDTCRRLIGYVPYSSMR